MFSREIHHFFHNIALRGFPFSAKSYLDGSRLSYLQKFYQSILMIFWNVKCNMDDDFFFCVGYLNIVIKFRFDLLNACDYRLFTRV